MSKISGVGNVHTVYKFSILIGLDAYCRIEAVVMMNELIGPLAPMSKGETFGGSDRGKSRAKNCLSFLTIKLFGVLLVVSAISNSTFAQSNSSFSPRLATKSIGSRFDATNSQNRYDITAGLSIDDVVSTPLQGNTTVNDTFIRTERQQGSLTFIYNTYNPYYVDNVMNNRAIDSLNLSDSVSKQIAAYEGTLVISRQLAASPMGNVFAEFSENLRAIRDALMFRVGHSESGEVEFEPTKKYGKSPTFLELRLTPNTRDGLAPRIRFGDNVSLSHDISGSTTFLEYNINF
jgi:hypothetical protein